MRYQEFVDEVEHTLDLDTRGEAVTVTRSVLTTFGERIGEGEAADLAAQLPMELYRYLATADGGRRFDFETFVERVAERADVEFPVARYYAQTVLALVAACVEAEELTDVREQLPPDHDELFELADQRPPEALLG